MTLGDLAQEFQREEFLLAGFAQELNNFGVVEVVTPGIREKNRGNIQLEETPLGKLFVERVLDQT
jgi:hypothetical protein